MKFQTRFGGSGQRALKQLPKNRVPNRNQSVQVPDGLLAIFYTIER